MDDLMLDKTTEELVDIAIKQGEICDEKVLEAINNLDPIAAYKEINLLESDFYRYYHLITIRENYIYNSDDAIHYDRWRTYCAKPKKYNDEIYKFLLDLNKKKIKGSLGDSIEYSVAQYEADGPKQGIETKKKIEKINLQLELLCAQFSRNYNDYLNEQYVILDKHDIEYLDDSIFAETEKTKSGWKLKINESILSYLLANHPNERIRKEAYEKYYGRIDENIKIANQILKLKKRKATLLEYETYSHYAVDGYNVADPKKVLRTFKHIEKRVKAKGRREKKALLNHFKVSNVEPYNRDYYICEYRKTICREHDITDYLQAEQVLENSLQYFGNLFAIRFERTDKKGWHKDVIHYEAYEGRNLIGSFYADLYYRDNKASGAWVDQIRYRTSKTEPCFVFMTNSRRTLEVEDVGVVLHELGHLLHGLLNKEIYLPINGLASLNEDLVEWPSQFIEHFATDAKCVSSILRHKDTKKKMPISTARDVFEKNNFGKCLSVLSYIEKSLLDIEMHTAGKVISEKDLTDSANRCYISGFLHAFTYGGYCSRYYVYIWSDIIARDSFEYVRQHKNKKHAMQQFKKSVLERTGTSSQKLFQKFANRRHNSKAWNKYYFDK